MYGLTPLLHEGSVWRICTCSWTGRHLATFTRRLGSSLYTLTTASAQVAESGPVTASSRVSASCLCRVLSHQTLLLHHRLGHFSLPRLRSMHSRLLVSGLPMSLPSLPHSLAPPCLPCVEGRQCATPHSSEFPLTTAPLQTLDMVVWGPAPVDGIDKERYFLLVDVSGVLIPWIRATRRLLRERFRWDLPVMRLHSERSGAFSFVLLAEFCRDEGIRQSFTFPASPQKNGIVEHRIGLIMEVAHTSMIHAVAPHFLWPFAVRYAAHQLNLWLRVSLPETSPTLRWTGKVGDAWVFRVWGAFSLVRDAKVSKLSSRTLRCVFLCFPTDAPPWQFYHRREHQSFSSQDVTFDNSVCFYKLHPHASHPGHLHEEIWLRRPSGFTDTFPPRTQWSLRRPVYGLHQSLREWHDTLRSTLRDLGFHPSSADPSLFVCAGSTPFFILVYVNYLVFATVDRAALAEVKSELQKRHTCTDLGELQRYLGLQITKDRAARTITLTQLTGPFPYEPFESSGPYAELVGCLMYLMTYNRPDLAFPLSVLSRFVVAGRYHPIHWTAAVRVAKYLATTSRMGLVFGGTQPTDFTCHYDSSYTDDAETQRSTQSYCFSLGAHAVLWRSTLSSSVASSSAEAEIYAGAMATQELRWLTFLLTDLGERPRSAPSLYSDNKAMILLCRGSRLESRVKHIDVRYFLLRDLRQRGQSHLDFVAS
ncbi:unnamed protein product [Closterium sp. NIES-54]